MFYFITLAPSFVVWNYLSLNYLDLKQQVYAGKIVGKWEIVGGNNISLTFAKGNLLSLQYKGKKAYDGKYKISRHRTDIEVAFDVLNCDGNRLEFSEIGGAPYQVTLKISFSSDNLVIERPLFPQWILFIADLSFPPEPKRKWIFKKS